ncbi:P-type conjugative transfer ATPase TrbB [Acidisoma cladoniae]|jgi:P-type conjugative transfer ATPase TrbB|uniref:P-type conjugative transfer ATPase TrbB n=1 Tax=Acidisoma cladoniae TaxID=3040935 RepID=UPI00254A6796|nr:P-type conjugative transfer ATPase TrbB [Acidisoma sp. PAMC 29798]
MDSGVNQTLGLAVDEFLRRMAEKLRRELGPQICGFLDDPDIIEIMLNPDGTLWIDRLGGEMEQVGTMSAMQAEGLMGTVASTLRTTINRENPVLECELPLDGSRFEAVIPPIVAAPSFTIRRKAVKVFTLEDYVSSGIMTGGQRTAIERAARERQNILVVGGTTTGKTTLTNAILRFIAEVSPHHRIVIIEDTAELQCTIGNHVMLRTSYNVDQLRLLKVTMRLRPDRICLGEARGSEALALLKAWNTGHPGGVCTVHANSARAGLIRMEQLIAEATPAPMCALIGEAVNVIVSIAKTPEGRRVKEVLSVEGFEDGQYRFSNAVTGEAEAPAEPYPGLLISEVLKENQDAT